MPRRSNGKPNTRKGKHLDQRAYRQHGPTLDETVDFLSDSMATELRWMLDHPKLIWESTCDLDFAVAQAEKSVVSILRNADASGDAKAVWHALRAAKLLLNVCAAVEAKDAERTAVLLYLLGYAERHSSSRPLTQKGLSAIDRSRSAGKKVAELAEPKHEAWCDKARDVLKQAQERKPPPKRKMSIRAVGRIIANHFHGHSDYGADSDTIRKIIAPIWGESQA